MKLSDWLLSWLTFYCYALIFAADSVFYKVSSLSSSTQNKIKRRFSWMVKSRITKVIIEMIGPTAFKIHIINNWCHASLLREFLKSHSTTLFYLLKINGMIFWLLVAVGLLSLNIHEQNIKTMTCCQKYMVERILSIDI